MIRPLIIDANNNHCKTNFIETKNYNKLVVVVFLLSFLNVFLQQKKEIQIESLF